MSSAPRRLTYANVVSTFALVIAVGGGGAAVAAGLAKNSVSSPQIKNGQVKTADLATNAVSGAKVKSNTLTGADIKESALVLDDVRLAAGPSSAINQILTNTDAAAASVTLTAPADGVVLVAAQASFRAEETSTYVVGTIKQDGVTVHNFDWDAGDVDPFFDQTQSRWVALPVVKGSHTYTLELREESVVAEYSALYNAQIAVQFSKTGTVGP